MECLSKGENPSMPIIMAMISRMKNTDISFNSSAEHMAYFTFLGKLKTSHARKYIGEYKDTRKVP